MSSGKNVAIAVLTGAAVGAIAGILFAPAKGTDTRQAIADKYSSLRGRAMDAKDDLIGRLENVKSNFEDAKENLKDDVREKLLTEIQKLEDKLTKA